jgi:hypothetical protein
MKHSKFKNTGLLFELLTRQITADILNNKTDSIAINLLKKAFNKKTQLFKENQLYNVILESNFKDDKKAEHLIKVTKSVYERAIDIKYLNVEKYNLIKSIKENFEIKDFFKSKIHNYKLLASIQNIFLENTEDPAALTRSYYTIVEHMVKKDVKKSKNTLSILRNENKDLRALTYRFLVEKFNKKYKSLSKDQKGVLREYINNVSNTNGLKEFIQLKYKNIIYELKKLLPEIDDKVVSIKIKECINIIDKNYNTIGINRTQHVLRVMRFYQLLEDIRSAVK